MIISRPLNVFSEGGFLLSKNNKSLNNKQRSPKNAHGVKATPFDLHSKDLIMKYKWNKNEE